MPKRTLSDDVRAKLRYVRVPDGEVCLDRFPDFFIVGPQRTATTWLHANLREHPEVFLAEPKELLFFNRLATPDHPKHKSAQLTWYLAYFGEQPHYWLYKQALSLWRHRTVYWPKVRGEASASYSALEPEIIAEVAALNPDLRIVMMVRDPVERAWSHAKKDLVRNAGRKFDDVTDDEWHAFFSDPYQLRCAQYARNAENWRAALGEDRVFVRDSSEASDRPESLLRETLDFLGVRSDLEHLGSSVGRVVNPAGHSEVPAKHRRYLEDLLGDEIASWRENYARD